MSGSFNTITGATLFESNSVTGGANDVEVNNLLVDGDCTVLGTLYANIPINAAGTITGAVQLRSSTGLLTASNNFTYNTSTNLLTTPQAFITGDAQIGDSASDILTINSNSIFNNDVTLGNSAVDILTVNSTAGFNNNVTIGASNADLLTCNAKSQYLGGIRFYSSQTYEKIFSSTGTTNASGNRTFTTPSGMFTSLPIATVSCVVNDPNMRICWIQTATFASGVATFVCKVVDTSNGAVASAPVNFICVGD